MTPRRSPARGGPVEERGTASAELAVALPALVLVLAVALAAVDLGVAHVRSVDAARSAARALARGDDRVAALAEASMTAPSGSTISTTHDRGRVTVVVSAPVPALVRPLGVARPRAVAVALLEVTP